MDWQRFKKGSKKVWWFISEDDSVASWIVNVILAFVLIKFIVYPGLGFAFSTSHPIVAVVSGSMEHKATIDPLGRFVLCDKIFDERKSVGFDVYWDACGSWYETNVDISKDQFKAFRYKGGFNTGDIMILKGTKPKDIGLGDVIVFQTSRRDPIIHRVVRKYDTGGEYYFQTKGDHNRGSNPDEIKIGENQIIGKALLRVPLLGWVKILFVKFLGLFGVGV